MKSEKVIFDEIKDVFDEFWDKQRETPNPRLKPINNFWKKIKFCQILADPHALNSRKMVGWKVATFKKDEEYFRCSSARSPTEVEVIRFQARESVSPTLIAANLLNFGSNCEMFGDPKREIQRWVRIPNSKRSNASVRSLGKRVERITQTRVFRLNQVIFW